LLNRTIEELGMDGQQFVETLRTATSSTLSPLDRLTDDPARGDTTGFQPAGLKRETAGQRHDLARAVTRRYGW
jgi:hypothetical protein